MFTDQPVTPMRLEVLIDLLRKFPDGLTRKQLHLLLQPEPLSRGDFSLSNETVKAAQQLGLLIDAGKGILACTPGCIKRRTSREAILEAFDEKVLGGTVVEPYLTLFYAFVLGQGKELNLRAKNTNQALFTSFKDNVFPHGFSDEAFNTTKIGGLYRWFSYLGLGWFDPAGNFQANPCERLARSFEDIFKGKKKLECDEFMSRLAKACPDLDGGKIFQQANPKYSAPDRRCSLGLSHALLEMHQDGAIRLSCPADSKGWSLVDADPLHISEFKDERFSTIELTAD